MAAGNISEFTSPVDTLHPTETGVEATSRAAQLGNRLFTETGQSVEQVGRQLGSDIGGGIKAAGEAADQYITHQQISKGAADAAAMLDNLGKAWDDRVKAANPNDTTVAADFRENTLEPALKAYQDSFSTTHGADFGLREADTMRNHFNTKMAADMGTLAKDAVDVNLKTLGNSWSNMAMRDPGSVPMLLAHSDEQVQAIIDSSPNVRGADAALMKSMHTLDAKQMIIKSGMIGAIQNSGDPEATAAAWIKKYPDYINGGEAIQAAKIAKSTVKFNNAQDKAAAVATKQLAEEDFKTKGSELVGSLIQSDGTIKPAGPEYFQTLKSLALHHPGATEGNIEAMFNFGQKNVNATQSDPVTKGELQASMISGDLKPIDLVKAQVAGKITEKDYTALEGQRKLLEEHPLNDKGFEAATAGAKASMVVPTNYSDFLQEFLPAYLHLDPKDKAAALNFNDPNSLISKTMATHLQQTSLWDKMFGAKPEAPKEPEVVPTGMTAAQAYAKYGTGTRVKLPDGRTGVFQAPIVPTR